jgi:hypothetical protein
MVHDATTMARNFVTMMRGVTTRGALTHNVVLQRWHAPLQQWRVALLCTDGRRHCCVMMVGRILVHDVALLQWWVAL